MLKMKAAGSLEMLVLAYQNTLLHIPEESNIVVHIIRIQTSQHFFEFCYCVHFTGRVIRDRISSLYEYSVFRCERESKEHRTLGWVYI